jgi:hypothetical protein
MTTFDKIKWVLGIVLVFGIVLATNLIDRQHFNAINDSIETIYADRLVAQNIIYDMSNAVYKKRLAYQRGEDNPAGWQQSLNQQLRNGLDQFSGTRLTSRESEIFERLQREVDRLEQLGGTEDLSSPPSEQVLVTIDRIKGYLDNLSEVQLLEGNRELHKSKKAIGSANFFTQLEVGLLVVLAILVQVIILYNPGSSDPETD